MIMEYQKIALVAGIILPFWNLPLILRIVKRRSAEDISIFWVVGVWLCLLFMAPASFVSRDIVWRIFSIINFILFTFVLVTVLAYKRIGGARCRK